MSRDISEILDGWDFEPGGVQVRIVSGDDGRDKIQLRLELGVLQMELDGRPDGKRPEGRESWLEYYRDVQQSHEAAHPESSPFRLDAIACERLLREGIQYYHRYLSFWHLQRYELCARDTNRNLRLFRFVREHARDEEQKRRFDQWRPYVTMIHARAVATPLVEIGLLDAALKAIDAGIRGIESFLDEYQQTDNAEQCQELTQLRQWRDEVAAKAVKRLPPREPSPPPAPPDPVDALRRELAEAVADERYEDAARLRDEIQRLG